MPYDTPHRKYLKLADATATLKHKKVLEVGGCTPPSLLRDLAPSKWTCANLNPEAVSAFNDEAAALQLTGYKAMLQDIATWDSDDTYERIYSINSFEHIGSLAKAMRKMYDALVPGGLLFTLFGPIWSSDVGHHLSISTGTGSLHFGDGVLEPWEHLTSTPEAIGAKLERLHGKDVAARAVEYIYHYPDINRLFDRDYTALIKDSGFSPVMVVRHKKGTPPQVPGATSTREFVLVLKKGRASLLEKVVAPVSFGVSYLLNRSLE